MENEKRLIDANALLLSIRTTLVRSKHKYAKNPIISDMLDGFDELVKGMVKNAPTVDAVEVVHASWIDEFGGKYANPKYICSNCTLKALYKEKLDVLGNWQTVQALTDYCPNCGAKMDGDGNVASE